MINGIINVYKEKGFTSHDVIAKLRGILKQKKIGHTGTLDPDAEGVLPVCLGKATKLCDMLTDKDKCYEAVLLLGRSTDTQDTSGVTLEEGSVTSTREEIIDTINSFIGEYKQIPPMYSALKVNGRKLYELAREGKTIEREARRVWIHNIEILDVNEAINEIKMVVSCSKGTYIRTLCHDIGAILGCGGCMKSLLRTKVSRFELSESLKLSQIEELQKEDKLAPYIIKIDDMFLNYDKVVVAKEFDKLIYNGNKFFKENLIDYTENINLKIDRIEIEKEIEKETEIDIVKETEILTVENTKVRVYDFMNNFIGIYEYTEEYSCYKPVKIFI